MKKGDYLAAKKENRKPINQATIILIVFIIVFIAVIFRFAIRSGTNEGFFSFMPTGEQAYKISTAFVRPAIQSSGDITFPDHDFQYSKNADSIFVIKSYYVTMNSDGHDARKNFTITLKYKGGSTADERSWTVLALQADK